MKIPVGPERLGAAATLVAIAILLLAATVGFAFYLAAANNSARTVANSQSIVSSNCGYSTDPQLNQSAAVSASCINSAESSGSTVLASGPLTLSNVTIASICYVSHCGDLPIMYVTFDLINTSQTNGTIVSLTLSCEACGIGGGTNSEGYSLAARLGGYDNESVYKCAIEAPEYDNVPPGNTSYSMTCYGPGSAWVTYPYQYQIDICIPTNLSSVGTCEQSATNLMLTVSAAPYGSHLIPRLMLDGGPAAPAAHRVTEANT